MAEASLFLVVTLTDIQALRSRGLAPGRLDRLVDSAGASPTKRRRKPVRLSGDRCGLIGGYCCGAPNNWRIVAKKASSLSSARF